MAKYVASLLAAALLFTPAGAYAWGGRGHAPHYHYGYSHGHHDGGDVAIGVLSGIVGGILIERILTAPPTYPSRAYDPYAAGYADGYRRGAENRSRDLYRQGQANGYYDAYHR